VGKIFKCLACGEDFRSKKACVSRMPKFCSRKCAGKRFAKPKTCLNCGSIFVNWNNKTFCSMTCNAKWKRGRPLSAQHKRALSMAKAGKLIPHLRTVEVRIKISISLAGKPQPWNRGKNHPNYKDGGRAAWARQKDMGRAEYKRWRRAVFERDDYTCQICGERGGRLCADHIMPYGDFPLLRYELSNGRTLCQDCHRRTKTYGRRKNSLGKRETEDFRTVRMGEKPAPD